MILIYNMLMIAAIAAGSPVLAAHVAATGKRRKTFWHRLGTTFGAPGQRRATKSEFRGRPLWIHALSVGEVMSAVPLVRGLAQSSVLPPMAFSAATLTGYDLARRQLDGLVRRVFFSPYDLVFSVRRVSSVVNPSGVVIVESDIWPNFLFEMRRRQVPVVLANARMSDRSFRGYRRIAPMAEWLFGGFSLICAQTEADADRFIRLGVSEHRLNITGNMKFDQEETKPVCESLEAVKRAVCGVKNGRVIVAGSTHEGEEEMLAGIFSRLKQRFPDAALIIAPRDPKRADSVGRIFHRQGIGVRKLTDVEADPGGMDANVVVVDVIGRLRQLYGIGEAAFVGGSLVDCGGHNPLEPAAYGLPVVFGPHTGDFREICRLLEAEGGAVRVKNAEDLTETWMSLLEDRDNASRIGRKANRVLIENRGAVFRTIRAITDCFRLQTVQGCPHAGKR